ncbi:type II toxin-antitoxin system VapC family toxin [Nostoc sp. ChiQUE01b]|uniref:type II toxin-antitoxin system VapC family toxin n=1 Tax=Nostoc sp. ChiQUE01b TaxID=3075376 RepID=UPI002AD502A2|nr:PIN domain-containing protein [Nostoc sp. ChiQUE01b]MDZ8264169.1 PIN domain-containing protein [Nostoc sp. ChiQUE01b]
MKYVIDTHALIWFLEGNSRLGANAKTILSNPDSQLITPATTLAEAIWIVERGRTSIPSQTNQANAIALPHKTQMRSHVWVQKLKYRSCIPYSNL